MGNWRWIGAAAGVVLFLLAGLWAWSPWNIPSSQDSTAPSLQHSISSDAAPKQLGSVFTNSVGAEMVYVPPGEFMLGSTPEERARAKANGATQEQLDNEGEQPRRAQIRNGFWMGRTEVSVGQWWQFVKAARYQTDAVRGLAVLDSYPEEKTEDHPATWITWTDAVAFCEWLTERERKTGGLPRKLSGLPAGYVMRLPTEAEWEHACRGGRQGTMFWWGDSLEDGNGRLNWREKDSGSKSTSVVDAFGDRGQNSFGLADMLGNVRELCLDAWDSVGAHGELCAEYVKSKSRVLKGGSFKSLAFDARCASRMPCLYSYGGSDIGFRVCCAVELPAARGAKTKTAPGKGTKPSQP
jgi:sulfatase modifying factor 1